MSVPVASAWWGVETGESMGLAGHQSSQVPRETVWQGKKMERDKLYPPLISLCVHISFTHIPADTHIQCGRGR